MIEFMVLSAPRSASTWISNWLTTEHTLCIHDPVLEHEPENLDSLCCDRVLGLACTGLSLLPDFVNAHPSRKVVIHRDFKDINQSLSLIGLSALSKAWEGALEKIKGMHVAYTDLFNPALAPRIYEHLTHRLFDVSRHAVLKRMHIDPEFNRLPVIPERARAFRERVHQAIQ